MGPLGLNIIVIMTSELGLILPDSGSITKTSS